MFLSVMGFIFTKALSSVLLAYIFAILQTSSRLIFLLNKGHSLTSESARLKKSLELILVNNCEIRSLQNHYWLEVLIGRHGFQAGQIRPWQTIPLNRSTALLVISLICVGISISTITLIKSLTLIDVNSPCNTTLFVNP